MDKKVRMADIARQLGVSVVSVSKALSGQSGVSEQTRARILETASQMGYVPLRTRDRSPGPPNSGNIGVLVADQFFADNTFYSSLYRSLVSRSSECGYSTLLELVTQKAEAERALPVMVQRKKVDGLIFLGEIDRDYLHAVCSCGLPYVLLDFYDEDLEVCSVTSDNVTGGYRLTKHLLDTGRDRIGFVGSVCSTSSITDRFLGYCKALYRADIRLRPDWVLEDRQGRTAYIPLTLPEDMPQAFVCNCDEVALRLIDALTKAGCRVPEDVAVAGYDDYHQDRPGFPPLTTYRVNTRQMGSAAINQLIRQISGEEAVSENIVVSGRIIQRRSTSIGIGGH